MPSVRRAQWDAGCTSAGSDRQRNWRLMQTGVWTGPRLHVEISVRPSWFRPACGDCKGQPDRGSLVYQLREGSSPEKENLIRIPEDLQKWREQCRIYAGHRISVCLISEHVSLNYPPFLAGITLKVGIHHLIVLLLKHFPVFIIKSGMPGKLFVLPSPLALKKKKKKHLVCQNLLVT